MLSYHVHDYYNINLEI